jgi:hypothetical protein
MTNLILVRYLIYTKVMAIRKWKVIIKMDYETESGIGGMKMDRRKKKELSRMGKRLVG